MAKHLVVGILVITSYLIVFPEQMKGATARQSIPSAVPIVHGLGSFVLPGLGQFMLGDRSTALTHFVVALAIPIACYYIDYISPFIPTYPVCGLVSLAWHAYSGIDAYDSARAGIGDLWGIDHFWRTRVPFEIASEVELT